MFGNVVVDRGGLKLLHTEPDAAAFLIDFKDECLHGLPFGDLVFRVIETLFVGDIRDVDHAFDAIAHIDKRTKLREVGDGAFESGANRDIFSEPRAHGSPSTCL